MNIKEFWQEQRAEAKQRKELKKKQKKRPLTKEQKAYKVFAIIFGFFVAFGAIFYSCSSLSSGDDNSTSWNNLIGISDEIVTELQKSIDENLMFPNGKIESADIESCNTCLTNAGIDIIVNGQIDEEKLENTQKLSTNILMDFRSAGALAKLLTDSDTAKVYDFEISFTEDTIIERSVVYVNLAKLISGENLPKIYLTTISEIAILNGQISILNSSLQINQLDNEMNTQVVSAINKNSSIYDLEDFGNSLINSSLNLFASAIGAKLDLNSNSLIFKVS